MKKVLLILGDFTFLDKRIDGKLCAITKRIDKVQLCKDEDEAGELGEQGLEYGSDGYLIPISYLANDEAKIIWEALIDEDTDIVFEAYSDLSYSECDNEKNIILFIEGVKCGEMKVWLDTEMNNREYLTINNEVIYLDTIKLI